MMESFTTVPNIYFDEYMPELSGAEIKVLFAIVRKTLGWQKESDEISIEQLQRTTGLSRNSVRAGLRGLLKRGLVVERTRAIGSKAASYSCAIPSSNGSSLDPLKGQSLTPKDDVGVKNYPLKGSKPNPLEGQNLTTDNDAGVKNYPLKGSSLDPLRGQSLTPQNKKEKKEREGARSSRAPASSSENQNNKMRDYLDHVLARLEGQDPAERIIRAWSLPPHLEAQCLSFARVFEVMPTKADKARWAKAAETLHELRCDEARLKAAREEASKAGLTCTWPGAVINLKAIRSIQQEYELVYDEERGGYVRKQKRN